MQAIKSTGTAGVRKILFCHGSANDDIAPWLESIGGYARSLMLIGLILSKVCFNMNNRLDMQLLSLINRELKEVDDGTFHEVRYEAENRYLKVVEPLILKSLGNNPLRKNGVYWITGGAGGLGLLFARYLAKVYQARLILTSRSARDERKIQLEKELKQLGGEAVYISGDVCDYEQMQSVFDIILSKYGLLNGVLHAAGLVSEHSIDKKSWNDFKRIFDPKITGSIVLDSVTASQALDLFVLFSSTSAIVGDFGQCDYAIGNRFMDDYARLRQDRVQQNTRQGKSISINWPLWKDGGMGQGNEGEGTYLKSVGMDYLYNDEGLAFLKLQSKGTKSSTLSSRVSVQVLTVLLG